MGGPPARVANRRSTERGRCQGGPAVITLPTSRLSALPAILDAREQSPPGEESRLREADPSCAWQEQPLRHSRIFPFRYRAATLPGFAATVMTFRRLICFPASPVLPIPHAPHPLPNSSHAIPLAAPSEAALAPKATRRGGSDNYGRMESGRATMHRPGVRMRVSLLHHLRLVEAGSPRPVLDGAPKVVHPSLSGLDVRPNSNDAVLHRLLF